jgi:hypothetical protein
MGRIAVVDIVENNETDGDIIPDVKIDPGGGALLLVPLMLLPGVDVRPMPGDYVATVSHPGGSGETAVAYGDPENESLADYGEFRVYTRDGNKVVMSTFWLRKDGSVRMENDNGFIELATNGQVSINDNLTVDP